MTPLHTPFSGIFSTLRQDLAANPQNAKAKFLLVSFRIAHGFAVSKSSNRFLWLVGVPWLILYRIIFEWILGMELPARTRVGAGLTVMHGQALIVNYMTIVGVGCTLRQSTTIGCKILPDGQPGPSPVLGDRVDVGSNVVILGDINIGSDAVIGAGSVVLKDVPEGAIVVGNPARTLRHKGPVPTKLV